MRTTAQIGEVTLRVCCDTAVLEILLDVLTLVGLTVGSKLLQSVGLSHLLANHGLFLRSQFLNLSLNLGEVALLDALAVLQQHIIEETILDSGAETELNARIQFLQRLSQQVGRCVPEGVLTLFIVKLVERNRCILVDRTVQLYCLTVYTTAYHAACESRRDALSNLKTSYALLIRTNRSVWESNVNHIYNICLSLKRAQRYTLSLTPPNFPLKNLSFSRFSRQAARCRSGGSASAMRPRFGHAGWCR